MKITSRYQKLLAAAQLHRSTPANVMTGCNCPLKYGIQDVRRAAPMDAASRVHGSGARPDFRPFGRRCPRRLVFTNAVYQRQWLPMLRELGQRQAWIDETVAAEDRGGIEILV